jgi:hypothetical protein
MKIEIYVILNEFSLGIIKKSELRVSVLVTLSKKFS